MLLLRLSQLKRIKEVSVIEVIELKDKDGNVIAIIEMDKFPLSINYIKRFKRKIYHIKETKNEALILN